MVATIWPKAALQVSPIAVDSRLRSPAEEILHLRIHLALEAVSNDTTYSRNVGEAMTGTTNTENKTRVRRVSRNQERSIGCIGTPADPSMRERTIGQVRHGFLEKLSNTLFGFNGNLMISKWYANMFRIAGICLPITIAGMLIAYLQFVLIRVRFHEETSLDIEQDGQISIQLSFFWGHLDVG